MSVSILKAGIATREDSADLERHLPALEFVDLQSFLDGFPQTVWLVDFVLSVARLQKLVQGVRVAVETMPSVLDDVVVVVEKEITLAAC